MAPRQLTMGEAFESPFSCPICVDPDQMPSLPAWLASRVASIKDEVQPDPQTGKWRTTPTLPSNLILTDDEREALEDHARHLEQARGPTPADSVDAEAAMLIELTKMFMVMPATTQNEASAEARGEAFIAALDDLPVWAVRSIRCWYRGDAGKDARGQPFDCHWCPAPADLRRVAVRELWHVNGRIALLWKLLAAEPLREFTEEHCQAMRVRLAQMIHQISRNSPVGKDGSGGVAGKCRWRCLLWDAAKAQPGLKREGGCRRRGDRRK